MVLRLLVCSTGFLLTFFFLFYLLFVAAADMFGSLLFSECFGFHFKHLNFRFFVFFLQIFREFMMDTQQSIDSVPLFAHVYAIQTRMIEEPKREKKKKKKRQSDSGELE